MGAAAVPAWVVYTALAVSAGATAYQIKSGEDQKKDAQKERDENMRRQKEEADKQAAALSTAPQKVGPSGGPLSSDATRRFRAGFMSTIKTSPLGLQGSAAGTPAALTPGKAKLGQ